MKNKLMKSIKNYNFCAREEFKREMCEILSHEKLAKLADFKQHYKCTRLKHSIDVAYISFYIAKLFGLDYISAGKAGLLHDLHFNDFDFNKNLSSGLNSQTKKIKSGFKYKLKLLHEHPKDALKNALGVCALNEKERDIIIRHMWLITLRPPKYSEGYVVSFVDKYCAAREFLSSVFSRKFAQKACRF